MEKVFSLDKIMNYKFIFDYFLVTSHDFFFQLRARVRLAAGGWNDLAVGNFTRRSTGSKFTPEFGADRT